MPEAGRVVAGSARGVRLEGAPSGTRALTDRVKESLFASLDAEGSLDGPFLDLYAGTGAGGIEALSRGAPLATFVEQDARAVALIDTNLRRAWLRTTTSEGGLVVRADVIGYLRDAKPGGGPFSAVLIDPPYDSQLVKPTLELLAERASILLTTGATVVVKHFWRDEPPERVGILVRGRQKRFGETTLSYYTRAE